ncbi:unnamed protein product, partial [Ceratitis capitata]
LHQLRGVNQDLLANFCQKTLAPIYPSSFNPFVLKYAGLPSATTSSTNHTEYQNGTVLAAIRRQSKHSKMTLKPYRIYE